MKSTGSVKSYAVAAALAVMAAVFVPAASVHAEEPATATDAVTVPEESIAVTADELDPVESGDAYYDIRYNGGYFDGVYYVLNDQIITNAFFCDGTDTYYLQYDGTPMTDRLTYHPDGKHIIYFDEYGHEVFDNFAEITMSISGDEVDDICYFNTYGYMYVDVLTWDTTGEEIIYITPYGVVQPEGWFRFSDTVTWADGTAADGYAGECGASDGIYLYRNAWGYDWEGKLVYLQGNGLRAYPVMTADGVASMIAANIPAGTDLERVSAAASIVAFICAHDTYTSEVEGYNTAEGVFVKGVYTCAGSTRALGLVLNYMGYTWTHVNENQWTHQWCSLTMDGQTGYADGMGGFAGYGSHPYAAFQ